MCALQRRNSFFKSINNSANAHIGKYKINWVENYIKEFGEKCVLQVVTDNHPSNTATKAC